MSTNEVLKPAPGTLEYVLQSIRALATAHVNNHNEWFNAIADEMEREVSGIIEARSPKGVQSVEELDALPVGVVIRSTDGAVKERLHAIPGVGNGWGGIGNESGFDSEFIDLPARVLFTPPQNGETS